MSQVRRHPCSVFVYHSSAFMSKRMTKELFRTSMLPDPFGDLWLELFGEVYHIEYFAFVS